MLCDLTRINLASIERKKSLYDFFVMCCKCQEY